MMSMSEYLKLQLLSLTREKREIVHAVVRDPALLELVELVVRSKDHDPDLRLRLLEGAA